jgi:hypothetical protein
VPGVADFGEAGVDVGELISQHLSLLAQALDLARLH